MPRSVTARLRGIVAFNLVTNDLERLSAFYREVLGLQPSGGQHRMSSAEMRLLGLSGAGTRQIFAVGAQSLALDQFEPPGSPYPMDGDAASLWFQHFALSVSDIGAAYSGLRDATPISVGGPALLPASSGGVRAFKFRDPEGHPLEFLEKPGSVGVSDCSGPLILGIDHSAVSVSDIAASSAFYEDCGLASGNRTLNQGPEQQRLDGLDDVEVDVVPMLPPEPGAHLELLGYRTPRGNPGGPRQTSDVASTRIVWHGDADALLRDPEGHLHEVHREIPHG